LGQQQHRQAVCAEWRVVMSAVAPLAFPLVPPLPLVPPVPLLLLGLRLVPLLPLVLSLVLVPLNLATKFPLDLAPKALGP